MAKNLVIVESPAKAGTIEKYLGPDYQVIASMGHVRDLPTSKMGVEIENDFTPSYIIPVKAKKTVASLKKALEGKEKVLLATDLDREGEAIAWHVLYALGLDKKKDIKVERITFDEITKTAIQNAVAHPRDLNMELIDAQQARRILDRLVGYSLSPVLWRKIYKGLSAGRVQSAALRLIVDKERERDAFKTVEYWSIDGLFENSTDKIKEFKAKLIEYKGKKIDVQTVGTETEAIEMDSNLRDSKYKIDKIESKNIQRKPQAPYTTSTFQQDSVNRLGLSAKNAMRIAQKLYESGLITYMRTDSVDISEQAVTEMSAMIKSKFGPNYLPEKRNFYKSSNKKAQEAHEAIRPSNANKLGNELNLEKVEQKVYELIWRRAVASLMKPALLEQQGVNIKGENGTFRANGQKVLFDGFLAVMPASDDEEKVNPTLNLKEGQDLDLNNILTEQHFTEPPARYSEASLIKALEEKGIGRPSTYAPIIDTLTLRKYIIVEQKRLIPEQIGFLVTDLLIEHFNEIVDLGFTAEMEEKLDQIAEGNRKYKEVLGEFWIPFKAQIDSSMVNIVKVDTSEETDEKCDKCGSPMVIKMGRFGKFMACSNFPECKNAKPLKEDSETGIFCPKCGKELVKKKTKKGFFFGCPGYPACEFALWKKEDLPKKIEELEAAGVELPFKDLNIPKAE